MAPRMCCFPHPIPSSWVAAEPPLRRIAFEAAARAGVTIVAAAGDDLTRANTTDGAAHVLFPASHPLVLGCGGTAIKKDCGPCAVCRAGCNYFAFFCFCWPTRTLTCSPWASLKAL